MNNKNIEIFYAAGRGGQYIFICPSLDLVTVITSKALNDSLGEYRPQIIMANYIIPAILPPLSPQRTVKIDSKIIGKYVGDYESLKVKISLKLFREGGRLFFKGPGVEQGELFPITETRFFGASKIIKNFQVNFFKDENGKVTHFIMQVGFGFWQFEKINELS